jgi:hypothetical protein
MSIALVCAGCAVLIAPSGAAGQLAGRLRALVPAARPSGTDRRRGMAGLAALISRHPHELGALAAGLATLLVLGGGAGGLAGLLVGGAAYRALRRLEPADRRRERKRRMAELPDALDLLAVGLAAGLPTPAALTAVGSAVGGSIGADLTAAGHLSALGAGPAAAWQEHRTDPVLGPVARAACRSADSGTALAAALVRLAADQRAEATLRGQAAAHRAGVLVLAPLGLCFLPAFICLGVVPVVLGIATQVWP